MRSVCVIQGFELGANASILESIATNPNTPCSILRQLVAHSEPDVRAVLADNKSTPLDAIYVLIHDENPDVRYQLAENHNLPIELLQHLAEDENPYVACRAQRTIRRIESENNSNRIGWSAFRRAQSMKLLRRLCRSLTSYARAT
jgi:hypothetical protein